MQAIIDARSATSKSGIIFDVCEMKELGDMHLEF